ncbi:MAG TPA: cellulase family glycosylhydrolase [Cytophagales bacterium]|nr:cellulase family glycosylhydrolase [Cytophagales bacterium]
MKKTNFTTLTRIKRFLIHGNIEKNKLANVFNKSLLVLMLLISASFQANSQNCWLETQGTQIVNANGQNVILRAVNLGNWGLQEGYMLHPQNGNLYNCQWKMKKAYYDQGQSEAQVEAFYQSWRNNFITKADIDYIASLGFNTIRLPMHYELFLTSAQRSVRNSVIRNIANHDNYKNSLQTALNNNQLFNDPNLEGFRMINNLLSWCASNNMYIILDLHAAPGGQGTDQNISDLFYPNDLWNQQVFKDVTVRLWERISARYKTEPRIAIYDLINEPNNVPNNQVIHDLYQRLITAIRNQGDNHMLMIEGNGWGNNYDYMEPYTFSPNWGLVYNAHRYWINASDDWVRDPNPNQINRMINLTEFRTRHNVPVFVGETGENTPEWLRQNIAWMEEWGIGWAHWTYKRHDVGENAALMRIGGNYPADGASVMSTVLEQIKYANNIKNTNTIAAVTARNPAPWTTGCSGTVTPPPPPTGGAPIGQTITLRGFNNQYVSSENGTGPMWCNRASVGTWEKFLVVDAGGGKIALRSMNKYVSSENGATSGITCNRTAIGGWEAFDWIQIGSNQVAFRGNNGQYISSENGTAVMRCNRATYSGWETFTYATTSAARLGADEEENSDLVFYPNPVQDKLLYKLPGGIDQHTITVNDAFGKSIYKGAFQNAGDQNLLDVSSWKAGLYIINISGSSFNKTFKVNKK